MNRVHRWFCRSTFWRRTLEERLLPWVLRDFDLGDHVLEVGPGPGLATDVLRKRACRLTAIEVDSELAGSLRVRLHGANVTVTNGDATSMPYADGRFSAVVCFTMLHHVPSRTLQDRLLAEVRRVLRPGALFVGSDSISSRAFEMLHWRDTLVPVAPGTFAARLRSAGFVDARVREARRAFRFEARRPL